MPQPTRGQVHVNQALTDVSVAFLQADTKYIARQVFPMIPVEFQSDEYFVYPKDQWFTDEMEQRAPGEPSAGSGYDLEADSYACKVYALHKLVPDQIVANSDPAIDNDADATRFLTQKYLINLEKRWANTFFTTGIWTGSTSGGDETPANLWDTAAGNPVNDVQKEMDAMEEKTSYRPNVMAVTPKVNRALRNNEDIKDRLKYVMPFKEADITDELMAQVLGVGRYLVGRATHNTAVEKAASANMSYIMNGNDAALYYAAPNPGLLVPTAGYTFTWSNLIPGGSGQTITSWRDNDRKSQKIEIEASDAQKLVASDLGVYFDGVVS
jgi:hypothetical protein